MRNYTVESVSSGSKYITLPFDNHLFSLEIKEVICGRRVSKVQLDTLKAVVGPNIHVWQRA